MNTTVQTRAEFPAEPEDAVPAARIADAVAELAAISERGPGVTRLAYSELERQAHDRFASWMRAAGCSVSVDPAGNTVATRPGTAAGLPAIGTGSHLDSVYSGGRFDGIAGVVAATEVARLFAERRVETAHPLRFVAFAGEEGARFGQACLGSKLAAGLASVRELRHLEDRDGVSVADAMATLGFDPVAAVGAPWRARDWAAFVELHVEQGSVLESGRIGVGAVDLISGSTRMELVLRGQPSHTGGTPMCGRADALTAAAEVVLGAERIALDARHRRSRATVGQLEVSPGSITTIPGEVRMSLDVRDVDADRQREIAAEVVRSAGAVCQRRGVRLDARALADTSPAVLPAWLRCSLTAAARDLGIGYRVMTSGASHDAQMINRVTPTGMVFVPSRAGLSHVPEEWTAPEQIAAGVRVLAAGLLKLDRELTQSTGESRSS